MASCGICLREAYDVPIPRDPNVAYAQGDVYGLKESVYTPIHDILQRTFGTGNPAYERSRKSFSDITSTADVIDNPRPAIIMDDQDDDEGEGLMVCLVTTYSNKDISELPRIFRHFSIAIASNDKMWHGYFDHLHALPKWGRENAYVIAWDFLSKATRDGAWTAQVDGKKVPQVIGRDGMSFLRVEINRRWEDWQVMCKDTKLAAKLEAELRGHIKKRNIEKRQERQARIYGGTGRKASSMSSLNSLTMGIDGPSWRSTMCSTTTIPEEPENDVVPETPHEPGIWKTTGKRRTGSTYSLASTSGKRADADKHSTKSFRSQISLAQKRRSGSGLFGFDILRAVKVNAG